MEKLIKEIERDLTKIKYETLIELRESFKDLIDKINVEIERRVEENL